ncbi:27 kDa hemolymph glycoprotein-like [Anopheles ziemanni]|uniref:27 kDa hemolymph glycoprotein-like n=1 Tax=Anopheles coustani TaxID=139045 RepID=UPI00265AF991|nr:27 kDa hemolymph glycoprotein-like [Anopheles coustani]XP_058178468.1 27 kDa hemolymph glycoprotein-like [Anopheles ziemanni]
MVNFSLVVGALALMAGTRAMFVPPEQNASPEALVFVNGIQKLCMNNSNSDDAFPQLMNSFQGTMMCVMTNFDPQSFVMDLNGLSSETRTTFFSQYCPQVKSVSSCLDGPLNAAKTCLQEHDYKLLKAVVGIFPDAVDLICKNDGELVFKLKDPKYKECLDKINENVMECAAPFASQAQHWEVSKLTKAQCGTITDLRQCLVRKLNACEAPDLINVYDLFHNTLFRMTPCRNYVTKVTEIENNTVNEN